MHQDIEKLLNAAKEKGSITEKQRDIILSKAEKLGEDISEVEFVLEDIPLKSGTSEKQHMKQCPNCGNKVAENTWKCPDCGYEFQNLEINKTIKKLFALLQEVDHDNHDSESVKGIVGGIIDDKNIRKKKSIIENFPIPNAKTDLFEFITALKPQALDTSDKLAISYFKKYEECINKAKALYPKDPVFLPLFMEYGDAKKVAKKTMRFNFLSGGIKKGCLIYMIWVIISTVLVAIMAILISLLS